MEFQNVLWCLVVYVSTGTSYIALLSIANKEDEPRCLTGNMSRSAKRSDEKSKLGTKLVQSLVTVEFLKIISNIEEFNGASPLAKQN